MTKESLRYIGLGLLYLALTVGLFFLIFRFGFGAAVKISEFMQKSKPLPKDSLTDNYLSAPQFNPVPEATNSAELAVSGFAPAKKEVLISLNSDSQSMFSDSEGKFSGTLFLALGSNTLSAVVKDFEGKTSSPSKIYTIFYSDSPPTLEVTSPEPGSTVKRNANITIVGKTDINSKVYVNDHLTLVNSDGTFSYEVKLQRGNNTFKLVSTDPAQNKAEKEVSFQFQP